MRGYDPEIDELYREKERIEQEIERQEDRMIRWSCLECHQTYEDFPGINEALPCSHCGGQTVEAGYSYSI